MKKHFCKILPVALLLIYLIKPGYALLGLMWSGMVLLVIAALAAVVLGIDKLLHSPVRSIRIRAAIGLLAAGLALTALILYRVPFPAKSGVVWARPYARNFVLDVQYACDINTASDGGYLVSIKHVVPSSAIPGIPVYHIAGKTTEDHWLLKAVVSRETGVDVRRHFDGYRHGKRDLRPGFGR